MPQLEVVIENLIKLLEVGRHRNSVDGIRNQKTVEFCLKARNEVLKKIPSREKITELRTWNEVFARASVDLLELRLESFPIFKKKMEKLTNFKIGTFIIKILSVSKDGKTTDICIYEEKKTSKILNKVQVGLDSRFSGKEWCSYFDNHNHTYSGKMVPIEILPDIARWLQAIHRVAAFT